MDRIPTSVIRAAGAVLLVLLGALAGPPAARAQDDTGIIQTAADSSSSVAPADTAEYISAMAGEFTPARGFDLFKSKRGSLNISVYGLFRYVNQTPGTQQFTDHLGRVRDVKARSDLNWHRTFAWITGFFYNPKFRYNISIWALGTTQQALVFGNLQYQANRALNLGVGIGPNLTARSMAGSWPFWASSDRQMSEEFMRGGFSSSFFISGQPVSRLYYTASVNTNLSQLGVTATNDSRDKAFSGTLFWMPSTGEFGPRGGFGDFEHHDKLATRFGGSICHAREDRAAPVGQTNNETQLRLSDGVYVFEAGALADTVTVKKLDYDYYSFDAGAKIAGFSLQGEFYYRKLSNFLSTSPLPINSIKDTGWMLEAMHMVVPKTLGLYAVGGKIYDEFNRKPWEISGGMSYYPYHSRSWRLNLHVIHVEKCPTGSNFGFYTAGQSGTTYSLGTDFLF